MIYKCELFLLTLCLLKIRGQEGVNFRFDYSFSKQADGWLKFHPVPSTWAEANLRCNAEGAILASPLTVQLREAILMHVSKESITQIFTGVHARFSGRDFASIEGVPLWRLPITWSPGQPKGVTNNCLAMATLGGAMASVECEDVLPYVCYKKRTELVMTECGTHDTGYKLDARTGSCYKFHPQGLDWHKAFMTCAAEGGYLAIINSDIELLAVKEILAAVKNEETYGTIRIHTYIGVRDLRDGGSWMTIHGETLRQAGFDQWSNGQPDNSTGISSEGEACVCVYRNGLLNDAYCGIISPFLCEMQPNSLENLSFD